MRIHEKSKKYRYPNLLSQGFRDGQIYIDVGDSCNVQAQLRFGTAKNVLCSSLLAIC